MTTGLSTVCSDKKLVYSREKKQKQKNVLNHSCRTQLLHNFNCIFRPLQINHAEMSLQGTACMTYISGTAKLVEVGVLPLRYIGFFEIYNTPVQIVHTLFNHVFSLYITF